MINVGVGLSRETETAVACRNAVRDAMEQAGLTRAAWCVCFFTTAHQPHADTVQRIVLEDSGCLAFAGCSATGVIGRGQEVEGRPALAVMVGAAPGMEARSAMLPETGEGLGAFAESVARPDGQPAVIALPDAFRVDNAQLARRMQAELAGVPVFGAGATDDGSLGMSLQVGMEGVRSGAIATLGFYGDFEISVGITQSCQAVGDPHFITRASEFVLEELDGRPALETFIEQGRELGLESMQDAAMQLLFGFPLDSRNPDFTGESCVVRPLAGFDQATHGLIIPYPMRQHEALGFMHRNAAMAERDVGRMLHDLVGRMAGPPDFGFYFDCAARGRGLYGREGVDMEAIRQTFGDFPLLGMFGGFELATALGSPNVYTYTGVLVLLRAA